MEQNKEYDQSKQIDVEKITGEKQPSLLADAFKNIEPLPPMVHQALVRGYSLKNENSQNKAQDEVENNFIDSLLSEFKRRGFNIENWDGEEGAEKAIVDGVLNQIHEWNHHPPAQDVQEAAKEYSYNYQDIRNLLIAITRRKNEYFDKSYEAGKKAEKQDKNEDVYRAIQNEVSSRGLELSWVIDNFPSPIRSRQLPSVEECWVKISELRSTVSEYDISQCVVIPNEKLQNFIHYSQGKTK